MKFKNLLVSTIILIGFVAINSSAFAQSRSSGEPIEKHSGNQLIKKLKSNTKPSTRFHAPQKNTVISQKTNAINSRLQALSTSWHDGVMFLPEDSIRLIWGGANHDPDLAQIFLSDIFYNLSSSPYIPSPDKPFIIKTDTMKSYEWEAGDGIFEMYSKTHATFDGQGNITSEIIQNTTDGINWQDNWRSLYTYDAQGNIVQVTEQGWTGVVWENYYKQEYSYDTQNNITENIRYSWDIGTSTWDNSYRSIITYEGSSKVNSLINQKWDTTENSWRNQSRYSMLYAGNKVTQLVEDSWSNGGSLWSHETKISHTYNASNQLTISQFYEWDDGAQDWYNDEKILFSYDEFGNNVNVIFQYWASGLWNYDYRADYTYSSLNLTIITYSGWDNSQFVGEERLVFSYNDYQQCTEVVIEGWDGNDWAAVEHSLLIRFYYEEFEDNTTGLGSIIDRNEFEVYPNPATDILKIKLNGKEIQQIRIIDVTGKTVFESRSGFQATEASIPVNQLQNGIYILQVTSENQTGAKSFVVSH